MVTVVFAVIHTETLDDGKVLTIEDTVYADREDAEYHIQQKDSSYRIEERQEEEGFCWCCGHPSPSL